MSRTPSYLTLRKGIYYFQLRVPVVVISKVKGRLHCIRRSTRTGNRSEALKIARKWWFEFMEDEDKKNKKKPTMLELDTLYENTVRDDELMRMGRDIFHQIAQQFHEEHDYDAMTAWVSELGDFEKEALVHFTQSTSPETKAYITQEMRERKKIELLQSVVKVHPHTPKSNKVLSDLLKSYLRKKKGEIRDKTLGEYEFVIGLLISALEDPFIHDISDHLLKDKFLEYIKFFPKKRSDKKFESCKNFHDFVRIARQQGDPAISLTTLDGHLSVCIGFLKWAKQVKEINDDFSDLFNAYRAKRSVVKRSQLDALPFDDHELKDIFSLEEFKNGIFLHQDPHIHWGLLLALYTGARVSEIAQLELKDIKKDSVKNISYISFHDIGERRLKTDGSSRTCPVHKDLIKLGFIKYCEHLREKGHRALFEELKSDKNGDNSGRRIARYFNETIRKKIFLQIPVGTRKSFHSFRHVLIDRAKQQYLSSGVFDQITGYSKQGRPSVREENYEELYPLQTLSNLLNKLEMGINIDSIKSWE